MLAGAGLELAEEVLQVPLHGFLADIQRLGDLLVRQIARQQLEDFALLGGEQAARRHGHGNRLQTRRLCRWS
ncbi:hypothetical protein D9M68_619300 [compost metagenome]